MLSVSLKSQIDMVLNEPDEVIIRHLLYIPVVDLFERLSWLAKVIHHLWECSKEDLYLFILCERHETIGSIFKGIYVLHIQTLVISINCCD